MRLCGKADCSTSIERGDNGHGRAETRIPPTRRKEAEMRGGDWAPGARRAEVVAERSRRVPRPKWEKRVMTSRVHRSGSLALRVATFRAMNDSSASSGATGRADA